MTVYNIWNYTTERDRWIVCESGLTEDEAVTSVRRRGKLAKVYKVEGVVFIALPENETPTGTQDPRRPSSR